MKLYETSSSAASNVEVNDAKAKEKQGAVPKLPTIGSFITASENESRNDGHQQRDLVDLHSKHL